MAGLASEAKRELPGEQRAHMVPTRHCPAIAPDRPPQERTVEREIVAAFESVFPRVGLRTFVTLQDDDKALQVSTLTSCLSRRSS